jgi:hypothetical protein
LVASIDCAENTFIIRQDLALSGRTGKPAPYVEAEKQATQEQKLELIPIRQLKGPAMHDVVGALGETLLLMRRNSRSEPQRVICIYRISTLSKTRNSQLLTLSLDSV